MQPSQKINRYLNYTSIEWREAKWHLYQWQHVHTSTHFTVQLYRLIAKADTNNRMRLAAGFALYVDCFLDWQESENPHEFFADVLRPVTR